MVFQGKLGAGPGLCGAFQHGCRLAAFSITTRWIKGSAPLTLTNLEGIMMPHSSSALGSAAWLAQGMAALPRGRAAGARASSVSWRCKSAAGAQPSLQGLNAKSPAQPPLRGLADGRLGRAPGCGGAVASRRAMHSEASDCFAWSL